MEILQGIHSVVDTRTIGLSDYAWKDKDRPEEAEAVHCGDNAMRSEWVHRLEHWQSVRAEPEQASNVTRNEMNQEECQCRSRMNGSSP